MMDQFELDPETGDRLQQREKVALEVSQNLNLIVYYMSSLQAKLPFPTKLDRGHGTLLPDVTEDIRFFHESH